MNVLLIITVLYDRVLKSMLSNLQLRVGCTKNRPRITNQQSLLDC